YVQAAAALSCIDSKLGDDLENRDKVEKDVLGKYGFDQSSYDKADSKFADKNAVKSEIESKLEDCDKAHAKKLAGLNEEGGEEAKQEEAKAKPKPMPAYVGSLSGEKSDASGFK
ncbi:MAG: hypothetical protein ABEN55_08030, partial [Bradymonadaceae bacterium]